MKERRIQCRLKLLGVSRKANPPLGSNTVRVLGAAVLFVFFASLISEQLLTAAVGKTNSPNLLAELSTKLTTLRISNVVALANSLGIVVLAVLFYRVLSQQNTTSAMIALGCGRHKPVDCGGDDSTL